MATLPLGAFFAPVVSAQTEQITWVRLRIYFLISLDITCVVCAPFQGMKTSFQPNPSLKRILCKLQSLFSRH